MHITVFYKDIWKGGFDGSDEELSLLLSRACDVVDNAIAYSGYTAETVPDVYKPRVFKAICAHADYINNTGGAESLTGDSYSSVSLGKFSYSADSSGDSAGSGALTLCPLAVGYLAPTGLLYRGVDVL